MVASGYLRPMCPFSGHCFNPLHCGAVVASHQYDDRPHGWGCVCFNPLHCGAVVASIRLSCLIYFLGLRFNPLHCGAVVASDYRVSRTVGLGRVSIPFIAGQWSLPWIISSSGYPGNVVSIPFIAGQWSLLPRTTPSSLFGVLLRKRRLPCDHIICTRLPF